MDTLGELEAETRDLVWLDSAAASPSAEAHAEPGAAEPGALADCVPVDLVDPPAGWKEQALRDAASLWSATREEAAAALAGREGGKSRSIVGHLFWRIGREAGLIRGGMSAAGISWGNFVDHTPEPHNNSHPNNLVVLPPPVTRSEPGVCASGSGGWAALLAPLDFDMSYTRSEYFALMTGEVDDKEFDASLQREESEMLHNLCGDMSSTGLEGIGSAIESETAAMQELHWALRDTLALGFKAGMHIAKHRFDAAASSGAGSSSKAVDPHPTCACVDAACRSLVQMALVLAADNVS
jgi:hypothetical protein